MKSVLRISLFALALLTSGCLDFLAGSTSTGNTGKGTIAGKVVDSEGKGVGNARVKVVAADHNPGPGGSGDVAAITVTESDGTFRTDSLPDGYYNLLDAKGELVALVDSIGVRSDTGALAGDAVLGAPGMVTGVVRLRPDDDSRTVFLVLIGTTTFAVPKDSIGNFSLAGLAEGEYRLRALSTLDAYAPLDTVIRVKSGRETVLPDTLRLAYRNMGALPFLDNPALEFDSARLTVRVSWARQDPSRVAGFNVYRRAADSGFVRVTDAPVKDTFFVDGWEHGFRPGRAYDYVVTALDSRGNEGLKGSASAFPASPSAHVDTLLDLTHCIGPACSPDIDSAGTIWQLSSDTLVSRITASGKTSQWALSLGVLGWGIGMRVDDSGGIYVLADAPLQVVKYDSSGQLLWKVTLPGSLTCMDNNCLSLKGDTVVVWSFMDRILYRILKDGALLEKVVVPSSIPMTGVHSVNFDPEVGFVGTNSSGDLVILDGKGKEISRWSPAQHGYLNDFTVDSQGRWLLDWNDGRTDIYSAGHELLRTIETPGLERRMFTRNGNLYAVVAWALLRIRRDL